MNLRMIAHLLGRTTIFFAASLCVPMAVGLYYGESPVPFLLAVAVSLAIALPCRRLRYDAAHFYARDGFVVVIVAWLLFCLLGAIPFVASGAIPSWVDALFESVSGLTTTGATILVEIEGLPRGILFWRSFTHWLGGMGVLVLAVALLPTLGGHAVQLLRAESTGPVPSRLAPRIADTAKILYALYACLTLLNVVALLLCGLGGLDAWITALGTAGTGGFSNLSSSIAGYNNPAAELVTTVFMLLFGVNFSLHFLLFRREWRAVISNEELRLYGIITAAAMLFIAVDIRPLLSTFGEALRYSSFQVASIITTTGYTTANFDLWPSFSKAILLLLMIMGSCVGSTSGGLKLLRVLVLFKAVRLEILRLLHPRAVRPLSIDGKPMDAKTSYGILVHVGLYIALWMVAILVVSLQGLSFEATISATISCISNVGPGYSEAYANYSIFSPFSKLVLSLCMLLGRVEILPFLLALFPSAWKSGQL